ncbi:MAG: hypothetical protein KC449_20095 [Anaerolineales bacterium]|nr:hypothetical protein [Anaerolineales bacterium]
MFQNIDPFSEAIAFVIGSLIGFSWDQLRAFNQRIRYRRSKVILTYQGHTILIRDISPEKMRQINAEPSDKSVYAKGVVSPYGYLGGDPLETPGLLTMSNKNRTLTIDLDQDKDFSVASPLQRIIAEKTNQQVESQLTILNFAHPLTAQQQARIANLANQQIETIHDIPCQLDNGRFFSQQIRDIINSIPLSAEAWQSSPILINPPAYAPVTATLLAELHGRIGHFPTIIRIRPIPDTDPTQYEAAELLNLQKIREDARKLRHSSIKNRKS